MSMPLVKMQELDNNSDGKVDKYKLVIQFKGDPSEVRHLNILCTFDYYLGEKKLKMKQIGLINLSVATPLGASKVVSSGDLVLK